MQDRYFEDFKVGDRVVSRGYTFTEASIIEYAQRFDPQPFHMDAEAAKDTVFGGVIASGWHTGSVTFRLLYDTGFIRGGSMGSNGTEHMKWGRAGPPGRHDPGRGGSVGQTGKLPRRPRLSDVSLEDPEPA